MFLCASFWPQALSPRSTRKSELAFRLSEGQSSIARTRAAIRAVTLGVQALPLRLPNELAARAPAANPSPLQREEGLRALPAAAGKDAPYLKGRDALDGRNPSPSRRAEMAALS